MYSWKLSFNAHEANMITIFRFVTWSTSMRTGPRWDLEPSGKGFLIGIFSVHHGKMTYSEIQSPGVIFSIGNAKFWPFLAFFFGFFLPFFGPFWPTRDFCRKFTSFLVVLTYKCVNNAKCKIEKDEVWWRHQNFKYVVWNTKKVP